MRLLLISLCALTFAACAHGKKSSDAKYSGLGLASVSKENLAKYAPPAPVAELKNDIEKIVDIRTTTQGLVSNDGKSLFTNWNVTGTLQVWKLQGPKSFPVQLTGGEDRAQLVSITADNAWLVLQRDSKADENFGIYLMSPNGGPLKKVYYNPKHQAYVVGLSKDSKYLYYRVNDKSPSSYGIYRYDIKSEQTDVVWDQPGIWTLSGVKDNLAILTLETGSMQNEHFILDLNTKKSEPLIGQNETEDYDVYFTPKKNEYVVVTNKLNDFRRIYILKDKKLKEITADFKADTNAGNISRDKKLLSFLVNDKGYSKGKILNLETRKVSDIPVQGPYEQMTLGQFSANNKYFTFSTQHHNEPQRNYVLNVATNKTTQWVTPSTPEVSTKDFIRPELLSYKTEDGTDIPMFVWRSEKCKKEACPVIISFHGGPESQFIPTFSPVINYYTTQGFVYVAPNVRGSDGYGKKWLKADNGADRLKVITDIRDASRFIKQNWKVNGQSRQVGIMGGSYGGYSTLVGMSLFAEDYDAGVAIVGMSSLITFIENTAPYRRALRMNEYGDPSKDRAVMEKLSPVSYIDKVTKPLLILHGATDPRVPVGEALQFFETVKGKNAKDQLVIFPDEGHGVQKRPNIVLLHSYAVDYFKKNLK